MLLQKIKKSAVLLLTGALLITFTGGSAIAAPKATTTPGAITKARVSSPKLDTKSIKTKLDALVKSKTITSSQATKVLAVYTKMASSTPNKPGSDNKKDGQRPKTTPGAIQPSGNQKDRPKTDGNNTSKNQDGQRDNNKTAMNPLADLVKTSVITQAQADAITKAIFSIKPTTGTTKK